MSLDAQTFNQLVKDPSSISMDNLEELEEIAGQYPYSNVVHILLYLGYAFHYPEEQDAYLENATLYSGSPDVLNKYFQKQEEAPEPVTGTPPSKESTTPAETIREEPSDKTGDKETVNYQNQPTSRKETASSPFNQDKETPETQKQDKQEETTATSASGQIFQRLSEEENQRILEEIESNLRQLQQYKKTFHEQESLKNTSSSATKKRGRPPKNNETKTSKSSSSASTKKTTASQTGKSEEKKSTSASTQNRKKSSGGAAQTSQKSGASTAKSTETTKKKPGRPSGSKNKSTSSGSGSTSTSKSKSKTTTASKSNTRQSRNASGSEGNSTKKKQQPVKGDAFDEINEKVHSSSKPEKTSSENDLLLNYLTSVNPNKYGHGENKNNQEDLIDRFIQLEPSISKPSETSETKETEENKRDLASESHESRWEVASENLAEIYARQGKKERAIETYEKLILKYPEKKSYFASCIEKLKKQ